MTYFRILPDAIYGPKVGIDGQRLFADAQFKQFDSV
jgi:hypothetical protein